MFSLENNMDDILIVLAGAESVFVNKNTFGDSVITAFWKTENEYYKLDTLLCRELPSLSKRSFDGKELIVVSASYIWSNRIEKIAEKEIRNHDDKKTLNHYKVARTISNYLADHKEEVYEIDSKRVESKLEATQTVLSILIEEKDLKEFIKIQLGLVRR